ncbi:MAG: MarR family transcriptional regulator [Sphingomonas bacterium]|nr:MarR family transcriptional regulator [Sphingomonas bacterium]
MASLAGSRRAKQEAAMKVDLISTLIICTDMNLETLPFEIAETAHALRRSFDRRVAPLGVTRAQWRALAWLARHPGLRQVELADHLDIEPITLCRIVDRLEEAGLVERRRDPEDRRAWRLHLTPKGEPLVEQLRDLAGKLALEAFAGVSPQTIETLREALTCVRDNISTTPESKRMSA